MEPGNPFHADYAPGWLAFRWAAIQKGASVNTSPAICSHLRIVTCCEQALTRFELMPVDFILGDYALVESNGSIPKESVMPSPTCLPPSLPTDLVQSKPRHLRASADAQRLPISAS